MKKTFFNNGLLNSILLLIFLVNVQTANATLINFEELGKQGDLFSDNPSLNNQYESSGITFSGGWEIIHQDALMGEMPLSGEHFAAFNTGVSGITNTIIMDFKNSIKSFSAFVGGGLGECCYIDMQWNVVAYLDQQFISQQSYVSNSSNSSGGYKQILLNFKEVNRIQISANPLVSTQSYFSGVMDDITFSHKVTVPEPTSILLFILAFTGLALRKYRIL